MTGITAAEAAQSDAALREKLVAERRLSAGHARCLLTLPTDELQRSLAEKIRLSLAKPYRLLVHHDQGGDTRIRHSCTASIGVVVFMNDKATQHDLLKWADAAMYQAKAAGRNTLRFFDVQMQTAVTQRATLEAALPYRDRFIGIGLDSSLHDAVRLRVPDRDRVAALVHSRQAAEAPHWHEAAQASFEAKVGKRIV